MTTVLHLHTSIPGISSVSVIYPILGINHQKSPRRLHLARDQRSDTAYARVTVLHPVRTTPAAQRAGGHSAHRSVLPNTRLVFAEPGCTVAELSVLAIPALQFRRQACRVIWLHCSRRPPRTRSIICLNCQAKTRKPDLHI